MYRQAAVIAAIMVMLTLPALAQSGTDPHPHPHHHARRPLGIGWCRIAYARSGWGRVSARSPAPPQGRLNICGQQENCDSLARR